MVYREKKGGGGGGRGDNTIEEAGTEDKKCRFIVFLCCLRTAAVPAHTKPFYPPRHAREKTYQAHSCAKVKYTRGPGNKASVLSTETEWWSKIIFIS